MAEGRHVSSSSGRRTTLYLVAAGVVVLGVAAVLFFVLPGDGGSLGLGGGDDDPESPELTFETTKIVAVPTRPDAKPQDLDEEARPAATLAVRLMDHLYTEAFLDRSSWVEGAYDEAWEVFSDPAAEEARRAVDTLTAGTAAGDAFETIEPTKSAVRVKVLFDANDRPTSVVTIVRFAAEGAGGDGSRTTMLSLGQFFLERVDGRWRVVSFQVRRDDEREAAPTASASASPTTEGA